MNNMPTELKITLLVILALVVIYALIVFCIGIYLLGLHTTIKKKATLINSILAQQYDIVRLLADMITSTGVELKEELRLSLGLHHEKRVKNLSTEDIMNIKQVLLTTTSTLIQMGDETELKDKKKYEVIKESLLEFSKNYRKEIVLYNQKIGNHNYWIKFLLFRPISKIFRLKRYNPL